MKVIDFDGHKVKIVAKNGKTFQGYATIYTDDETDEDYISLRVEHHIELFNDENVASIEIID